MSWLKALFIRWPASIWRRLVALRASLKSLLETFVQTELGKPIYVLSIVGLLGVFFILLGTGSLPWVEKDFYTNYKFIERTKEFWKEFGVALFIGAILGGTVELYNRLRHEKEKKETEQRFLDLAGKITEDVSKKITREGIFALFPALSPSIIGATQDQILESKITREEFRIMLEFEVAGGSLLVTTTVRYKLRNPSEKSQPFRFSFAFEPEITTGFKRETCLKYLKIASDEFNGIGAMENGGLVQRDESKKITGICKSVAVPEKEVVSVVFHFTENREFDDLDYWIMTNPSDGLSLTVISCPGLAYYVDALHPDEPDIEPSALDARVKTWALPRGLLPGQGLLLRWRCNPGSAMI